jgi:hypothetical protein
VPLWPNFKDSNVKPFKDTSEQTVKPPFDQFARVGHIHLHLKCILYAPNQEKERGRKDERNGGGQNEKRDTVRRDKLTERLRRRGRTGSSKQNIQPNEKESERV